MGGGYRDGGVTMRFLQPKPVVQTLIEIILISLCLIVKLNLNAEAQQAVKAGDSTE